MVAVDNLSVCLLQPCGVDYELRAYIAEECDEKPQARCVYFYFQFAICPTMCVPVFVLGSCDSYNLAFAYWHVITRIWMKQRMPNMKFRQFVLRQK